MARGRDPGFRRRTVSLKSSERTLRSRQTSFGSGWPALLAVALVAAAGWACSGQSVAYGSSAVQESRAAAGEGRTYEQLAVTPMDPEGYDPQIAGRVERQLQSHGYEAEMILVEGAPTSVPVVMEAICTGEQTPLRADGVVFVTWDRLVLRDCETREGAYEVSGGYSGVDALVEHMVRYFRGEPARTDG